MSFEGLSGLMNRIFAWADRLQRKHGVLGFPYAVVKKYGDDDGGRQAALITYYGFLSIFPLLLLGVAVLSRVLADHPDLRRRLIAEIVPPALRPTIEHSLAAMPTSTVGDEYQFVLGDRPAWHQRSPVPVLPAYEAIFGVTARHAAILARRSDGRRAVTRKPGKLHAY